MSRRVAKDISCTTLKGHTSFVSRLGFSPHEIQTWQTRGNEQCATVKWQFTTDDARIKLKNWLMKSITVGVKFSFALIIDMSHYCFVTPKLMGRKIASTARSYSKIRRQHDIHGCAKYVLSITLDVTE